MNAPIVRVFGLVILLFGLLVAFTSRWAVLDADDLRKNPNNRRELLEDARIERGLIKASDGTVLARSVKAGGGTFQRRYPENDLFSQTLGYSFTDLGRSGTELFRNDELADRGSEFGSILDQLEGQAREGDDVVLNLDPDAQRVAEQALGGQKGSIVAIEPSTGRVRVMLSNPQFDINDVGKDFPQLVKAEGSPLLNRATQASYPPGSVFKVVTAIAAIDSGEFTPGSTLDGSNGKPISGVPLQNSGGASFGTIDLTEALTNSVNTVWAQVGEALGKETMGRYMTKLGFYAKPPLDYPPGQRRASGEYGGQTLLSPTSDQIDVGRMAIGQDKLAVTPLQMAMVVSAVANDGRLAKPRLADRVVDPDGRVRDEVDPETEEVMKKSTADTVAQMMTNVVREGTGTAAALSGVDVAGKTGTAEIIPGSVNQPWFVAFAPVDEPRIAIAVTVERSSGQGGTVAAPIAKQVLEALL